MARIAGVNLPVNKRALVSLTYIHGIGPKYAMDILKANSLDPTKRIKDFSEDEISKIRKIQALVKFDVFLTQKFEHMLKC